MDELKDWLSTSGLTILIIVVVTWVALHFGMRVIKGTIRRAIERDPKTASERDQKLRYKTLVRIIGSLFKILVLFIAIMMILSEFGVNLAPLFAGVGVVSLAIGFGAQDLVKDIVAGIFILAENQYRVGDIVELEGFSGMVEKMSLRITVIRDLDGNVHYIPNGSFAQATNKTMEYSNVNLNIGVSYDADIDKAEATINEIGEKMVQDKKWKHEIVEAPHFLRVNNLDDSKVEIKIIGKTQPNKQLSLIHI